MLETLPNSDWKTSHIYSIRPVHDMRTLGSTNPPDSRVTSHSHVLYVT